MKAARVLMPRWRHALKLYHMKLTLAYSSLLALLVHSDSSLPDRVAACIVQKMGNDRRDRC